MGIEEGIPNAFTFLQEVVGKIVCGKVGSEHLSRGVVVGGNHPWMRTTVLYQAKRSSKDHSIFLLVIPRLFIESLGMTPGFES